MKRAKSIISEYFIFVIFIALVVVLTCLKPSFIAPLNLVNIMKQASINGILAFGMMFVIVAGGFDMSVGSTVAFTGILAAMLGQGDLPLIVPLVVAMLGGLVYITRALRLRDDRKAAKLMYIKGAVYMMIFIVLNVVNGYLF